MRKTESFASSSPTAHRWTSGPVPEGNVGGGTGMICYEFKGGIGTSSRRFSQRGRTYTVGVLVQANHGLREQLLVAGVPTLCAVSDNGEIVAAGWLQPSGAEVKIGGKVHPDHRRPGFRRAQYP